MALLRCAGRPTSTGRPARSCGWTGQLLPNAGLPCPDCGGVLTSVRPASVAVPVLIDRHDLAALLLVARYTLQRAEQGSQLAVAAGRVVALGRSAETQLTSSAPSTNGHKKEGRTCGN